MVGETLHEEEEDDTKTSETFKLNVPRVEKVVRRSSDQNVQKEPRRLSYHGSVGQMSSYSNGKSRSNGSRVSNSHRHSKMLETPFAAALLQPPNYPDMVRGENWKYVSQRASFDSAILCRIIWIFCYLGWFIGSVDILIQALVCLHNSLHWRWGIGFWSGAVFSAHATVGFMTMSRLLRVPLRTRIAEFYLACCVFLGLTCCAEMTCAVYTYNHASELINRTISEDDEWSYRVAANEVSVFNSLLSGCGLIGILIAIMGATVTLQRLNIELKIAQSFSNLVSRRSSAIPPPLNAERSGEKSVLNFQAGQDEVDA